MIYNDFLLMLKEYQRDASSKEQAILERVLLDPLFAVDKSVSELAILCNVSTASIIRMCQKMGLSGYKEFQKKLAFYLGSLKNSTVEHAFSLVSSEDTTEQIIQKITAKNVSSIEATMKLVDPETLETVAQALKSAHYVTFFGMGASYLVAYDLQLKLMRVEKHSYLSADWHSQYLSAQFLTKDDLAIAFSYSGCTEEVLTCCEIAKTRGAKLVVITSSETNSEMIKMADIVLDVAATELVVRSGAMSSRIAMLNVVDMLFATYVRNDYEQCMRMFVSNQMPKFGKRLKVK